MRPRVLVLVACLSLPSGVLAQQGSFETPGVHPVGGNRVGFTYRSFSQLHDYCELCRRTCHNEGQRCIAWTCFHPTWLGSWPGPFGGKPLTCHLKEEFPPLSPDPAGPPPRAPTSGNGVRDDRCYASSQAPSDLPSHPLRQGGLKRSVAVPDPTVATSLQIELQEEERLLGQIEAYLASSGLKETISVHPACGRGKGAQKSFRDPKVGGYWMDGCYGFGSGCGKPAADEFCRQHGYRESERHEWKYESPTMTIGTRQVCDGGGCGRMTLIVCLAGPSESAPPADDGATFHDPRVGGQSMDGCLGYAAGCGKPAADEFCRQQGFRESEDHEWTYGSPTRTIGTGELCEGSHCGRMTVIRCVAKLR